MSESDRVINYDFELELTMHNIFWVSFSPLYLFTDAKFLQKNLALIHFSIYADSCKELQKTNKPKLRKISETRMDERSDRLTNK